MLSAEHKFLFFGGIPLMSMIPGYALHEKGLQRQISNGPLVSSQERRAAVTPRINRWSTAGCVPQSVYIGFVCSRFRSVVQYSCLRCFGGQEGRSSPGRSVPSASCPAPPRRASPPRPDPPVVCPGFGFDEFLETWGGVPSVQPRQPRGAQVRADEPLSMIPGPVSNSRTCLV